MKKLLTLLFFFAAVNNLQAQKTDTAKGIPPYRILTKDSVYLTPAALKHTMPVMIIYFSPDCVHCQRLTDELKTQMDKELKQADKTIRHTQIIMVTFAMLQSIQVFYMDYELSKYPNIIVGTEGYTYLVQRYYHVKSTPYIAVYDKKGKLIKGFDKSPKLADLIAALKLGS